MKRRLNISIPIAVLGALLVASPAPAQRVFGGRPGPSSGHSPSGRPGWGRPPGTDQRGSFGYALHPRSGFGFRQSGWGYGRGWGWDYLPFSSFYDRGEEYARPDYEPPEPQQQVVMEPPQPEKLIQPILIERQGDAWVQVAGYKEGRVSGQSEPLKSEETAHLRTASPSEKAASVSAGQVPPAVLVFRDGHQEEVKSYTIIGHTLYAKSDYWASGSWSRKIEFANLDVPATLKLNEEHGSKFTLPSGPREIVIGP